RLAEARGYRVLRARPAESEAKLSYAALADVVGPAFDEARAQLPHPQELALAGALLRVTSSEPADPRTVATAVVGVLTELVGEQPVLVAIDDVQWVDLASRRALEFAARRLPAQLRLFVTRRSEGAADVPLELDRALPPDAFERVVLGSLSLASLHHIVRERLGTSPARPVIARIAEASGGNPFFAIEIARAIGGAAADPGDHGPLPVPQSVQKLAAGRVNALSGAAREAVLVAAALSRPTAGAVVTALPDEPDGGAAIAEAEDAGVLVTEHGRIRFTHPLLASAVYASVSEARRRALHRRLAEVVSDAEERARHLSQSLSDADESVAVQIEGAARQAVLRGAFDAAAELFGAACRLTPAANRESLVRRRLSQAAALLRTGDVADARRLAESMEMDGLPPALQAERLQLLAEVEWDDGSIPLATSYLEQALEVAGGDPPLSARISARLVLITVPGNPARALQHAERAVGHVDGERDPLVLSSLLIDLCLLDLLLGRPPRTDLMRRGLALEERAGPSAYPHPVPLIWFQCTDDLEATRERHAREAVWARDHSDEAHATERLSYLALAEFHAGRCDLAMRLIEQSCDTIEERLEVSGRFAYPFAWRSLMDAYRGRFDRARQTLVPLLAGTAHAQKSWWAAVLLSVLGFVEFAAGEYRAADDAVSRMGRLLDQIGISDGLLDRTEPFHAELLVQLGQLDRAGEALARLEHRGRTFPRPWIDVTLPRTRAIVLAAEGDLRGALEALGSLDPGTGARLPLELGWTWLTKGRLLRRAKQRRAAADAFAQAAAIFEQLGAVPWAERARAELDVTGPRRRAPDELTATERRVAELAAAGITNREIARAVFMSQKTVEAHIARVYRKLGIHSRAELGARMAGNPANSEGRT
ncbi:MAG TPA: LuxR C-terminal-related transcriptional regulator, partial [Streptosporangiaceae bacterium]|nr:LuxR C-terminal-related transcriptional regulator [Streptosporangiaceae bacterium]